MSDLTMILVIVASAVHGFIALFVCCIAWTDYGDDKNLLRVTLKSLRGFVWPIWLAIFLVGYAKTRFRKDAEEMFSIRLSEDDDLVPEPKRVVGVSRPSRAAPLTPEAAEREPRHEPYEWMN